jgi:hypothetical protein
MKIGIVICDRYRTCGGGRCFRAARERAGAFSGYPANELLEVVGFSTCGGCPRGNVEYVPEEMIRRALASWPRPEGHPELLATEEVRRAYD